MREQLKKHKSKLIASAVALGAVATVFSVAHRHSEHGGHEGLAASDITDEMLFQGDAEWRTGRVVLDMVDPQEGEGGSETEILAAVRAIDNIPGVTVESGGFYSESDHLYLLSFEDSATFWAEMTSTSTGGTPLGEALELVEGVEYEAVYEIPDADTVESDYVVARPTPKPRKEVNDPYFFYQWHLEQIHAPEAWASQAGEGVIVAVLDTGVAWKDSAYGPQLPDLKGVKFTAGKSFASGLPDGLDGHAHGSHVAGTIAQATNNGVGVAGVAHEATIMPLKVLSDEGWGSTTDIANAIRYAADNGAHVINMSLGGPAPSRVMAKAVEYAHKKGTLVVCAAGNDNSPEAHYPSGYRYAVSVAASDFERKRTFYSNYGKTLDFAAPGGDTRSDKNGDGQPDGVLQNTIHVGDPSRNDYLWFQGTSMASPHAAGVAALIYGEGVTNPDEVLRIMRETAVHPRGKDWDDQLGTGILDAKAAVDMAHTDYAPERGLLTGLGILLLGGFGLAGFSTVRGKLFGLAAFSGSAMAASGALGIVPLAYALASVTGSYDAALWMSAAVPLAATVVGWSFKPLRPFVAGLALGYAALLTHGAIVLPTVLDTYPGALLMDRIWMAVNAAVSLVLAARISHK